VAGLALRDPGRRRTWILSCALTESVCHQPTDPGSGLRIQRNAEPESGAPGLHRNSQVAARTAAAGWIRHAKANGTRLGGATARELAGC
jgi:hypothetical protein